VSGSLTVLIMAAGEGTRMRSSLPKVLHPVCGRPMVAWPVFAARQAGADRVAVIVSPERDLSGALPDGVETVVQPEADGTGGAARAALQLIRESETVVVLSGDHPAIAPETVRGLIDAHRDDAAGATLVTMELDDPGSYGRIVRDGDGRVARIVETKEPTDATPEELAIREINTGTYAFAAAPLAEALGEISNDNSQGEYYIGDVLPLFRDEGLAIIAHRADDHGVTLGVNTRADLARAAQALRERILDHHMLAGVTVVDPAATWIDADVEIEPDVTIEPGSMLRGPTRIGGGSTIGPFTTLAMCTIGARASIVHSHLTDCEVLDGCTVGPFTYIRPGTRLGEGAKAGAYVEIKNTDVGARAKVPHLSYLGDAEVGEGSNIGAGSITANYDGFRKHRTVIGRAVRIGVDTALIAPVHVGDDAYTGAGSVIAEDVPPGALGISRPEQRNVEGYAGKRAKKAEETES
jgi:bifunctional UDP-N-acetylglucosamine pyrophosphorylase / glucosamine-1-phosphate N-acetyltransferase